MSHPCKNCGQLTSWYSEFFDDYYCKNGKCYEKKVIKCPICDEEFDDDEKTKCNVCHGYVCNDCTLGYHGGSIYECFGSHVCMNVQCIITHKTTNCNVSDNGDNSTRALINSSQKIDILENDEKKLKTKVKKLKEKVKELEKENEELKEENLKLKLTPGELYEEVKEHFEYSVKNEHQ